MPVKKCDNGKYRIGEGPCTFKSKKDAEAAQKAAHATEKTMIKEPNDKVMKATADDIRGYLRDAVSAAFAFENGWVYGIDYDGQFVYFDVDYNDNRYYTITYKLAYILEGVTVSLGDELIKVKKETTYTEVKDEINSIFFEDGDIFRSMEKGFGKLFKRYFGKKEDSKELPVIKQFDDEEMRAIEVMYSYPDEADGHNEGVKADTIVSMVNSCNKAIEEGRLSGGLFHAENREDIEIVKTWVNPCDCIIGDISVPEGAALAEVQFHSEELWELRKDGTLGGLSIGARCTGRTLNENYIEE